MVLLLSLTALLVGGLIGMVGIGGVLLAPALAASGVLTTHEATATSTWAFLFTGVVGTCVYGFRGLIPWPMLGWLAIGVVPSAFAGAWVNSVLPAAVVLLALAALTLFAGIRQLLPQRGDQAGTTPPVALLITVGAAVGFGSALTGTGGPVLLVPVLLMLGVAPLRAVAVSQAVQLPVVISGSVGYIGAGLTDVGLGSLLGLAAAVGTLGGATVATRFRADSLRTIVAFACIGVGIWLFSWSVV